MEFRSPTVAAQKNADAARYLTQNLSDPAAGLRNVELLIDELGNAVQCYPDWHPILTVPPRAGRHIDNLSQIKAYAGMNHTTEFVRGFVTFPRADEKADALVHSVSQLTGLYARRLEQPLHSDSSHPVVVVATNVELETDGTIRGRDALAWFVRQIADQAEGAQVAETWWNMRTNILGGPHGARSSLFVSQHTGLHMRKILESMNASGMFGPILESSLSMLSQNKRNAINETLIRTAVNSWDGTSKSFTFEMRGETCKAHVSDTWDDNYELQVSVEIGNHELNVSGFYYPSDRTLTYGDPRGKRKLAEKFL